MYMKPIRAHVCHADDEAHAMFFLERAYDERNPRLLDLQVDPALDHLRVHPVFATWSVAWSCRQ